MPFSDIVIVPHLLCPPSRDSQLKELDVQLQAHSIDITPVRTNITDSTLKKWS
jgi:hypothetical protein